MAAVFTIRRPREANGRRRERKRGEGKETQRKFEFIKGPTHCDPEEGPRLSAVAFSAEALGMTACLSLGSPESTQEEKPRERPKYI